MTLKEALARYPGAETFTFGDNKTLCEDLLTRVREGHKTATCGALHYFQKGGEALPVIGRQDISLTWEGQPALVIETVEVTVRRFCDIDESFALAEGENDSLAGWRADHEAYFRRNGYFRPEMELVCERFRLIEDFGQI